MSDFGLISAIIVTVNLSGHHDKPPEATINNLFIVFMLVLKYMLSVNSIDTLNLIFFRIVLFI